MGLSCNSRLFSPSWNKTKQTNKTVVATSTCCREEPFPLTLKLSSAHTPKPINKTQNPTQSHIYTREINIWRAVHIYWLCTLWKHFETVLLNVPLSSHPACTLHSLFLAPLITYFCAVFTTWLIPTSPLNSVNSFYTVILGFIFLLWPTTPPVFHKYMFSLRLSRFSLFQHPIPILISYQLSCLFREVNLDLSSWSPF